MKTFKKYYDDHADYAYKLCYSILKNEASAQDAVQEAFIRAYRKWETYDKNKPFRPWLSRILVNECYRILEKEKKVIHLEFDESASSSKESLSFDEHDDLDKAISSLDDEQRIPLILKYIDDLTNEEIADILKLNVNTVKSRLFKARQKLKETLEPVYKNWRG